LSINVRVDWLVILAALLVAWVCTFSAFGLYQAHSRADKHGEAVGIALAAALAVLLSLAPAAALHIGRLGWRQTGATWIGATVAALMLRAIVRSVLSRFAVRRSPPRYTVIVGTGPRAVRFARQLEADPDMGDHILGFVDDVWNNMEDIGKMGYNLLSTLADFPNLLTDTVIDQVVMCLPMKSQYQRAAAVVALCAEQGINVRMPSDIFDGRNGDISDANGSWRAARHGFNSPSESVTTFVAVTATAAEMTGKRVLDIVLASVLLALAAPILILVSVWIKFESPGPLLFRQMRRGLNKRPFTMLKFRTMRAGAEMMLSAVEHLNIAGCPAFKIPNDPRITRCGRWLRRFSIDEVPQLINVFKGDMSLVGPRPMFAWEFERLDPWIKRRCSVRPGLTGLWQVSGRSSLPFERRIELDLHYIDNWSLIMDIAILARTVPAVLSGRGAV
jgi:exopolysaccharide biosynthesis polyprenyl glycosylphosphotransferase